MTDDGKSSARDESPGTTGRREGESRTAEASSASRLTALRSRQRLGKFISVGAIGALCDTFVFIFLIEFVGLLEEIAVLIGIETAILVMFLINDRWTFANEGRTDRQSKLYRLGKSNVVRIVGSVTHVFVFVVVYRLLFISVPVAGIEGWAVFAKLCGILAGGAVNYIFESLVTWRVHVEFQEE